jgi:hypothetical protein
LRRHAASDDARRFLIPQKVTDAPFLIVRPFMAVGTERDEILNRMVVRFVPRDDMRIFERERRATDGAVMTSLEKNLTLCFDGDTRPNLRH